MFKLIFVLCFLGNCFGEDEHLIVETSLGKIRGHYKKTFLGKFYRSFEGVPYAEPPLGALRFRDPEPIRPWPGTLFAGRIEGNCMAYLHEKVAVNGDRVDGTEDCLFLNIYTPENKTMLPVLFYMHGGSFQFGTGNRAESRYIMNRDVVFVSVNYRLGPFGFLSTEDEVVPGNMGLKDQSLAIKWVKNHIEAFGSDPNRITLVGLSAGGASVQYHYLSPMSRGLFHGKKLFLYIDFFLHLKSWNINQRHSAGLLGSNRKLSRKIQKISLNLGLSYNEHFINGRVLKNAAWQRDFLSSRGIPALALQPNHTIRASHRAEIPERVYWPFTSRNNN
ncbi:venom carboxylesterase-6-like [Cotesia glomerata]|uniref:venom carboxylesterase-6-like n=1 Tax=Cotesia glomerata TaxID=32391 RepID=UPI001D02B082|nr:venom carboxylesterase-6-like [Cotesia glomerata]